MKKNLIIIIGIILIGGLISYLTYNFIKNSERKSLYEIEYYEDFIPGRTSYIKIYKNYEIEVIVSPSCSLLDCSSVKDTKHEYSFSKEGKKALKTYLKELFKNENTNNVRLISSELNEYNSSAISNLVFGDEESFLSIVND